MSSAYNFHFAVALCVVIDQEAYPGMFDGPRGFLVNGLTGTIIAKGGERPGYYGCVQIKIDEQWNDRIKRLGWIDNTPWFLSGALSLHPDAIEETRQYCLKELRNCRRKITEAHGAMDRGQSPTYWKPFIAFREQEIAEIQQAWQGVTRLPALQEEEEEKPDVRATAADTQDHH